MADAIDAHSIALEYGGGRPGIRDINTLAGALGRPFHGYHRFIHEKCAALLHGVASSHGFTDANKRTAWLVTFILIERSGYHLETLEDDRIDDVAVAVVERTMTEGELAIWFKDRLIRAL
ncbi:type II toxin-antitoxin system death-on-curing family toxin [Paracoccus haematequi]|uniref:type II toxin-antitoxin system death-on-curing family toxin n=1 Tax=Paracoccus haematequi TaxID=2491866 RepID=UPI0013E044AF|nr:type II toxin-antitoxin system death-on-curing family toxin [Paracoccus haematequi]